MYTPSVVVDFSIFSSVVMDFALQTETALYMYVQYVYIHMYVCIMIVIIIVYTRAYIAVYTQ